MGRVSVSSLASPRVGKSSELEFSLGDMLREVKALELPDVSSRFVVRLKERGPERINVTVGGVGGVVGFGVG